MTDNGTSGQSVQKSPEGLFLMDGIEGLRSLPRHSVDMLLTDPPYGTTRNFWDVPLPPPTAPGAVGAHPKSSGWCRKADRSRAYPQNDGAGSAGPQCHP